MRNKWIYIVFGSLSSIFLICFIVALILEKGFKTWSGIAFGAIVLCLLPILVKALMSFAISSDAVVKPNPKDFEKDSDKSENK